MQNTIIVPFIRNDFLGKMLDTLYKYTEPNFKVIVIDQMRNNKAYEENKDKAHLWIRPHRGLGFAKAMNIGIRLADTPYVTLANDDIEFLDNRWWQGILDTFAMDENIIAVNPMSPKEGAWGYGLTNANKDTWKPKEGFFIDPDDSNSVVPDFNGVPLSLETAKQEGSYDFLLNNHPTWSKGTTCDGIAMWCTVFKKEGLDEVGLLDERFYPGGGEDYDMLGRAYSCAWPKERDECNPELHRRMVGTTKSWVWHHWGMSKDKLEKGKIEMSRPNWNNMGELWQNGFDVWGHYTENGVKKPYKRVLDVYLDEL